jgi:two-component system chemotaxis response regulator CheY
MQALIIDDSRAMRQILRRMIEPLGFEIHEAENGRQGLLRLDDLKQLELVLVDWNMPEMNGIDLVKSVRANPEYSNLKLVMVTTETEPTKMACALMAGVDEFLMKPFTRDMLLDKLELIGVATPNPIRS